jgi:ABC-type lipoprotein export system ATPase subunit
MPTSDRDQYRNRTVGFVFQFYHLLPELNVLDNTMLPDLISAGRRGWFNGLAAGATGLIAGMGIGVALKWIATSAGWVEDAEIGGYLIVGGLFGLIISMLLWPTILQRFWPGIQRRRTAAIELLTSFGLGHRLKHRPRELSGGERQRVAIARALMNNPRVLLADEPTGNLDEKTGGEILDLIAKQHQQGLTIVMVTHDPAIAKRADRIVRLHDGRVADG